MGARMGWVKSLGKDQIASPEVFGATSFAPAGLLTSQSSSVT